MRHYRHTLVCLLLLAGILLLLSIALSVPAAAQQATPAAPTPAPTPPPTQTVTEVLGIDVPYRTFVAGLEQFGLPGFVGLLLLGAAFAFVSALAKKSGESLVDYVYRVFLGRKLDQRIARIEAEETRQAATRKAHQEHTRSITTYLHWLQESLEKVQMIPIEVSERQKALLLDDLYIPLRVVERTQIEGVEQLHLGDFDPASEHRVRQEALKALSQSQRVYRLLSDPDPRPPSETREPTSTRLRLLLIGRAGSGKTTTLHFGARILAHDYLHQTTENARDRLDMQCTRPCLPFYIRLTLVARYVREKHAHTSPDDLPRFDGAPGNLLLDWLDSYLAERVSNPEQALSPHSASRCIQEGGCLLLLDGLDETGDADMRRYMQDVISDIATRYPHNRYLVASRPFTGLAMPEFDERHLSPLNEDEIQQLLHNWFGAWRKSGGSSHQDEQATDQAAYLWGILAEPLNFRLLDMATNPLLLTSMALLVQTGATLPRERAAIYHKLVTLLLDSWRNQQKKHGMLRLEGNDTLLYAESPSSVQDSLQTIAAWMQEQQHREIQFDEACRLLSPVYAQKPGHSEDYIHQLLHSLALESGILQQRDNRFSFTHYTLQEYLTARAYDERTDGIERLFDRRSEARWRETILLAVGHWATSGNRSKAQEFIRCLLASYDTHADTQALLLAAASLDDANALQVARLADLLSETIARLRIFPFANPPIDSNPRIRNQAAELLDRLNADTRDALLLEHPAYWAQRIEPGPFIMGDDNGTYDDEKPAFTCHIRRPYALARFPVTNRQYKAFLDDLARQGRGAEAQQRRLRRWPGMRYRPGEGNHPVMEVSWEDACAFAAWVNQLLHEQSILGADEEVRLPTEPEWERAAAYPVQLSADQPGAGKRVYPWGDGWDEAGQPGAASPALTTTTDAGIITGVRANTHESSIGGTSVVGIFPHGAAGCEAEELAGNVWEWCSTRRFPYPLPENLVAETIFNTKEYADRTYVLRGGSWGDSSSSARCARRNVNRPDLVFDNVGVRLARLFS